MGIELVETFDLGSCMAGNGRNFLYQVEVVVAGRARCMGLAFLSLRRLSERRLSRNRQKVVVRTFEDRRYLAGALSPLPCRIQTWHRHVFSLGSVIWSDEFLITLGQTATVGIPSLSWGMETCGEGVMRASVDVEERATVSTIFPCGCHYLFPSLNCACCSPCVTEADPPPKVTSCASAVILFLLNDLASIWTVSRVLEIFGDISMKYDGSRSLQSETCVVQKTVCMYPAKCVVCRHAQGGERKHDLVACANFRLFELGKGTAQNSGCVVVWTSYYFLSVVTYSAGVWRRKVTRGGGGVSASANGIVSLCLRLFALKACTGRPLWRDAATAKLSPGCVGGVYFGSWICFVCEGAALRFCWMRRGRGCGGNLWRLCRYLLEDVVRSLGIVPAPAMDCDL